MTDRDFVPDLFLEQFRLGELPEPDGERTRRALRTDPSVQRRIDGLAGSDERIAAAYPPSWLAGAIRQRLAGAGMDSGRARLLFRWSFPVATAAAALVLIMAIPRIPAGSAPDDAGGPLDFARGGPLDSARGGPAPTERVKGLRPSLLVYRRTAHGTETLADGAIARPGDLLRLGYAAVDRPFGAILSIDGRGRVTMHLPANGHMAAPLGRGDKTLLDTAFELDDAPRWERFYLVTAREAFAIDAIIEAARRAAGRVAERPPDALDLPRGYDQAAFLLQKEVKP
jgi:hypothetical protein